MNVGVIEIVLSARKLTIAQFLLLFKTSFILHQEKEERFGLVSLFNGISTLFR